MKKKIRYAIAILLVLCLCTGQFGVPVSAADSTAIDVQVAVTYYQTNARSMLEYVNELRTGDDAWYWNSDDTTKTTLTDLTELTYDYELEKVAMQRAAEVALSFSHTRTDGTTCWTAYSDNGYTYYAAGENIAAGSSTALGAFTQWAEEDESYSGQGHRRNMLSSSFTSIAIACVRYNGTYYWVMELSKPRTSGSTYTDAVNEATSVEVEIDSSDVTSISSVAAESVSVAEGDSTTLPSVTARIIMTESWPSTVRPVTITSADWSVVDESVAVLTTNDSGETVLTGVSAGSTTLTATVLGTTVSADVTVTHANAIYHEGTDATCTEDGQADYYECSYCGEIFLDEEMTQAVDENGLVISAAGHDHEGAVTIEATCTTDGVMTYTCAACGDTYTEVIPATGHTIITDEAVAATCGTNGLTEGSHCSTCGEIITAQETIPATGNHTWNEGVITTEAADYESTGIKTYTCTVCGATKTEEYTFINGTVSSGVRNAILWAAENGISKGYTSGADNGTFGVGRTVTREEMVIFLYRLSNLTGKNTSARADITFADADEIKTNTGKTAISWAVAEGIAKGYTDGSNDFGPQDECTREQICIFLWRLAGKPSVSAAELAAVSDFSDADEISNDTAKKAIAWAYDEGIIKGYTNSDEFGPKDSCLREQFAIMMYRYAN